MYCAMYDISMKKKSKMGRPPIDPRQKRAAVITFRLKAVDLAELDKDAKAAGMTRTDYLVYCWKKVGTK
jgi:hypothetical protein